MLSIDLNRDYVKQTTSKSRIRFQDCDPLCHLNNAKYFDYFFNAREDEISDLYGFNLADVFQAYRAGWVAYSQKISYVRSALPGELVTIHSRVIFADEKMAVLEYLMSDESDTKLKSVLWTTIKYIDLKAGKSTTHPPEIQGFFDKILYHEANYENVDFETRVKHLIQEYKKK